MARKFGIELEICGGEHNMSDVARIITDAGIRCNVEGYNHATRRDWKIVSDGSLQGRNMMELVSPPLKGRRGVSIVETVANALKANGVTVNASCGMHVHVDARDLTAQHMKNVAKLVTIHELHLKAILPSSRHSSMWAQWPSNLGLGSDVPARCAKIDRAATIGELMRLWGSHRYRAVNFESLSRHNTIEFRSHSGSVESRKIAAWIMLCTGIVRNAEQDADIGQKLPCGTVRQFTNLIRFAGKANVGYFQERRAHFAAQQ